MCPSLLQNGLKWFLKESAVLVGSALLLAVNGLLLRYHETEDGRCFCERDPSSLLLLYLKNNTVPGNLLRSQ